MIEQNILIIDESEDTRKLLQTELSGEGYRVSCVDAGIKALDVLEKKDIDLVILEVSLSDMSGYDLVKKIKTMDALRKTPIVFLSNQSGEKDILLGFKSGANDYITKPFSTDILNARVESLLRSHGAGGDCYAFKEFELFWNRHLVKVEKQRITLTPREFDVLSILIQRRNRTVSRDSLLERGWGVESNSSTRSVDIIITRIRNKIQAFGKCIRTVTGYGYQWDEEGYLEMLLSERSIAS